MMDEWTRHMMARVKELEPIALGDPIPDDAILFTYFNYAMRLNNLGIGFSVEFNPRNPFGKNYKLNNKNTSYSSSIEKILTNQPKNIDMAPKLSNTTDMNMTEKEQNLIDFLVSRTDELRPSVMGDVEPLMTDRMTFFAYNQMLWHKFHIGSNMMNHPRNPWQGIEAPKDFNEYCQIKPLPEDLQDRKPPVITVEKPKTLIVLPDDNIPVPMWRVYDINVPNRNVYQGTIGACEDYAAKANKQMGYTGFKCADTNTKFVPKNKIKNNKSTCLIPMIVPKTTIGNCGGTTGCSNYTIHKYVPKEPVKSRVAKYLELTSKQPSITISS
jgi:hypothetical protein